MPHNPKHDLEGIRSRCPTPSRSTATTPPTSLQPNLRLFEDQLPAVISGNTVTLLPSIPRRSSVRQSFLCKQTRKICEDHVFMPFFLLMPSSPEVFVEREGCLLWAGLSQNRSANTRRVLRYNRGSSFRLKRFFFRRDSLTRNRRKEKKRNCTKILVECL